MAGINLQGGFGAGAAVDELHRILAERFREEQEKNQVTQEQNRLAEAAARREEDARQANMRNVVDTGHLGVAQGGLALNTRRLEHDITQDDTMNPARIGLIRAQTEDLNRQPTESEKNRLLQVDLSKMRINADTLKQAQDQANEEKNIHLRGGEQRQTEAARPQTAQEKMVAVKTLDGGGIEYIPASEAKNRTPAPTQRQSVGQQKTDLGFYRRMVEALDVMNDTEDKLSSKDVAVINNLPYWTPDIARRAALSPEGRQYANALKTYTEARLRKESGAYVSPSEYQNDRDVVGRQLSDDPKTLLNRRRIRETTAEGIGFSSGPAYEEYFGTPFPKGERLSRISGGTNEQRVKVKGPNGERGTVPASEANSLPTGWTVVKGG